MYAHAGRGKRARRGKTRKRDRCIPPRYRCYRGHRTRICIMRVHVVRFRFSYYYSCFVRCFYSRASVDGFVPLTNKPPAAASRRNARAPLEISNASTAAAAAAVTGGDMTGRLVCARAPHSRSLPLHQTRALSLRLSSNSLSSVFFPYHRRKDNDERRAPITYTAIVTYTANRDFFTVYHRIAVYASSN